MESTSILGKVGSLVTSFLDQTTNMNKYLASPLTDVEKNAFKFLVLSTTAITLLIVLILNGLVIKTIYYFICIMFVLFVFYYITADDASRNRINSVWCRINMIFNRGIQQFFDAWFGSTTPPSESPPSQQQQPNKNSVVNEDVLFESKFKKS
jgi:hypothetical protein